MMTGRLWGGRERAFDEERDEAMKIDATTKRRLSAALTLVVMLMPAVAFAAGGGGGHHGDHHFPWGHYLASWFNFAVFAAILWKFALPKINEFFHNRRELLMANLNEAKRLREEAERNLEEYQARLDALEEEREELLEEYNRQGEREKEKIIEEAQRQVEKMRADAERLIDQEVKKAVAMLEQRAVDHAVEMAYKLAGEKLDGVSKQKKLVDRYVEDLGALDRLN